MAKENTVQLIGIIKDIIKDDVNKITKFKVETIRRNGRIDTPSVLAYASTFDKTRGLQNGDFAIIKGIVGTSDVKRGFICPACHNHIIFDAITTNVILIDAVKLTGQHNLEDFKEMSNVVYILGTLCRDIKLQTLRSGVKNAQYQMAVNRKLNVREQPERWTDYPFISSLGEQAEQDYMRMEEGSQCFINGGLQTRTIVRAYKCPDCNNIIQAQEEIMEVCPYNVEYLNNCKFDEE